MCVSDGNPKPNVTINGTNIREVGKGVVKAEITGKKVQLWCHAENRLKLASKNLTGNAAGGLFVCFLPLFRVAGQCHFPLPYRTLLVPK